MAQVIWTGPALRDLQEIAEYIALDNREAAINVVARVEQHVEKLAKFPRLEPAIQEMAGPETRQLVEPPCRIFYKVSSNKVYILHVLRFERRLRPSRLEEEEEP